MNKCFPLLTCSMEGCDRYARHWLRCDEKNPNRRVPFCHRCYNDRPIQPAVTPNPFVLEVIHR